MGRLPETPHALASSDAIILKVGGIILVQATYREDGQ